MSFFTQPGGGGIRFKCNLFYFGDGMQQHYTNTHTVPLGGSNQEDAEQVLRAFGKGDTRGF